MRAETQADIEGAVKVQVDRRTQLVHWLTLQAGARIPLYLEQRAKGAGGWRTMPKWTHSRLYGQSAN